MSSSAGIIIIGDEILSGRTKDTNINWIANELNEIGIDISNNKSKKIDIDKLNDFDLVITLCGDAKDKCPVINSNKHIHWDIPDPAKFQGSEDQIRIEFSRIRDIIYDYIISMLLLL